MTNNQKILNLLYSQARQISAHYSQMNLMQHYSAIYKFTPSHSVNTLTYSFKNSGRNQKHAFGARFAKPMHDLDYSKPVTNKISTKNKSKSPQNSGSLSNKKKRVQTTEFRIKSLTQSQKIISPQRGIQAKKYLLKPLNPQSLELKRDESLRKSMQLKRNQSNKSSPMFKTSSNFKQSNFGLSQCELQNTIIGKIGRKSSHHIVFQKMPDRPVNINKIWYKKDQSFSPIDRQKGRASTHKIHYFKSDSPHKVFEPSNPLDKFYDAPIQKIKKRSDVDIRETNKMKARPSLQIKLGTNLQYEKNRSLQNKKRPIIQLSQTSRNLTFTREIISPKRGAYR